MSAVHQFRHQTYDSTRPAAPHHLIDPRRGPQPGSNEFRRRMQLVGDVLRDSGVSAIYLVHGTFVGPDALGIITELGRVFPSASNAVRRVIKRIVDRVAGEVGNYTPDFAQCLESSINTPNKPPIAVRLFHWSSENHHIGRADGAVRLIDELFSADVEHGRRVLLWGHSHAGNVFALMTNLLCGDEEKTRQFFDAAAIYYRWPLVGCVDIPVWNRVENLLSEGASPLAGVSLDMVTFGTPIRYGWDSAGYANLLHFINHHVAEGVPEYRAAFPPTLNDVMRAADGDYVQQFGIAGTNVMPSVFAWRTWMADNRLSNLLQGETRRRDTLGRLQAGAIVPDEGTTLLVDYGRQQGGLAEHIAGHAVYTRKTWMLFHAEEIARRFYA